MSQGRTIEWSPQGWLLVDPQTKEGKEQRNLTFSEISYAVLQTVTESEKVMEEITDAVQKKTNFMNNVDF